MLISEVVEIKWNSKNKKTYCDKGYSYTQNGDVFTVSTKDLTNGSHVEVLVRCDYCGKEYKKEWCHYVSEGKHGTVTKDCCNDCKRYKIVDVARRKYGVDSVLSLGSVKKQIRATNLERYGAENPFASEAVKQKIANTNLEKYGNAVASKNQSVKDKAKQTCLSRYGVKSYTLLDVRSGERNPRWKGGVKYHRQERATGEYRDWRNAVFAKDCYTCQKCGARNGEGAEITINAHHINNWGDYPDKRYDVSNGITLCEKCHREFHSIYGKKNNNEEQIYDFLFDNGKKIC